MKKTSGGRLNVATEGAIAMRHNDYSSSSKWPITPYWKHYAEAQDCKGWQIETCEARSYAARSHKKRRTCGAADVCRAASDRSFQSASAKELRVRGVGAFQGNLGRLGTIAERGRHFHGAGVAISSVFNEPARHAGFGFSFDAFVDDLVDLLSKVGCPVQAGELDGFESRPGTLRQLFEVEVVVRVPHGCIPPKEWNNYECEGMVGGSVVPYGYHTVTRRSGYCQEVFSEKARSILITESGRPTAPMVEHVDSG
jgi:hypothetical protein